MADGMAGMGLALAGLRRLAGLEILDRLGVREQVTDFVGRATSTGFGAATQAGRTFAKVTKPRKDAARQEPRKPKPLFDLTPTDEQQMLVEALGEFAAEHLRPGAHDADHDGATPEKVLDMAAEFGVLHLGIPAELGGYVEERSTVTSVLAAAAMAHGDMGQAVASLAPAAVANALALWGTAAQQDRWLAPFTGDTPPVAALAVTEPRPLFDPTALQTKATRDGEGFVLSGRKSMVARVGDAELFLVSADLDGTPALFVVESGADGLTWQAEPTMGIRAAASGQLDLADVKVDGEALLGGGDPQVHAELVARSRIMWSALAVGTCQAVLDYVIPYVNERHAFGEPISHRQAVAFAVADIAVELEGLRLVTLRAAALADQGKPFTHEAALARQLTASKAMQIGNQGVQLLGGHGYVKEHPVERWYRDLRGAGLAEGVVLA